MASIPVKLDLDIELSQGVPIRGSTALDSVSIELSLADTPFKEIIEKLKKALGELQK